MQACRPRMQRSAADGNQRRFRRIYGDGRAARARAAARRADPLARPGRRQPHDLLVPGMSDVTLRRVGHKGADHIAPGNTTASFDAALAADVDMIEFDVLPRDHLDPADAPADPRPRLRARAAGRAHAGGGPRPPRAAAVRRHRARRRPQAARLRAARGRGAAPARADRADDRLHALHAQPRRAARARAAAAARLVGAARAARLHHDGADGACPPSALLLQHAPPAARDRRRRTCAPGAATR